MGACQEGCGTGQDLRALSHGFEVTQPSCRSWPLSPVPCSAWPPGMALSKCSSASHPALGTAAVHWGPLVLVWLRAPTECWARMKGSLCDIQPVRVPGEGEVQVSPSRRGGWPGLHSETLSLSPPQNRHFFLIRVRCRAQKLLCACVLHLWDDRSCPAALPRPNLLPH